MPQEELSPSPHNPGVVRASRGWDGAPSENADVVEPDEASRLLPGLVRSKDVNHAERSRANPRHEKPWSAEACDDWNERFGRASAPGGRIGAALRPLVQAHGWLKVRPAWRRYLAEREPRFASPNDFSAKFAAWTQPASASGDSAMAPPEYSRRPTLGEGNVAVATRFVARGGKES